MTRAKAIVTLRGLAASIAEPTHDAEVCRLLERIATRDDADELRAGLLEAGASALLQRSSEAA